MIHLLGLAIYAGSVAAIGAYKSHQQRQKPGQNLGQNGEQKALPVAVAAPVQPAHAQSDITDGGIDGVVIAAVEPAATPEANPSPSSNSAELELEAKHIDHHLKVAGVSFGLALVGRIFFPPLGLLSLIPLAYAAHPVNEMAVRKFRERRINITMLDSVALVVGVGFGLFVMNALSCILYLSGSKMLHSTRNQARSRLSNIFNTRVQDVWVLVDGVEISMPLTAVKKGDLLVLNAGEMVPVDGEVIDGLAMIDQHQLTGEAQPAEKIVGQKVFAATLLIAGRVIVRVEKTGQDTVATQITLALEGTDDYIATLQTRGEKVADASVLPTLGVTGAALVTTGVGAGAAVISSNYSEIMRVAVPLTMVNYLRLASRAGVLIKDGRSLEQMMKVDTVVFDKTGTLTHEQPHVGRILPEEGLSENELLALMASAEYRQSHPVALAVLAEAKQRGIELHAIEDAEYQLGYGLTVRYQGDEIKVGSRRFMLNEAVLLPAAIDEIQAQANFSGHSLLYCSRNDRFAGVVELKPTLRPEAKRVVRQLQERGLQVVILSGDQTEPVARLAQELGVKRYYAETLPEGKAEVVEQLQAEGRVVCFVGDGINDSIALKRAAVSVSLEDGSHIARDSAQIILLDQNLEQLVAALDMAKRFARQRDNAINYGVALPSVISMTGGLFFGFTVANAMLFYSISAVSGFSIAMLPMLMDKLASAKSEDKKK